MAEPMEGMAEGGNEALEEASGTQGMADEEQSGMADESEAKQSENGEEAAQKSEADWELAAPADFPLPEENLKSFSEAAKKLGLTREQAEGMLGWHKAFHEEALAANEAAMKQVINGWRNELAKDVEFGGAKSKETLAAARRALAVFDPDGGLRALLRESGYQFHPEVVRAVARIGQAMGEHEFIGAGGSEKRAPLHERMYPEMKN